MGDTALEAPRIPVALAARRSWTDTNTEKQEVADGTL
jgi:hypothetical protein